jgi:hypothetical protein
MKHIKISLPHIFKQFHIPLFKDNFYFNLKDFRVTVKGAQIAFAEKH